MESVFEQQRKEHEEMERIELIIANELSHPPKKHREKLIQEHYVNSLLERMHLICKSLYDKYIDKDDHRKKELTRLEVNSDMSEYYLQLRKVKEANRMGQGFNEVVVPIEVELANAKEKFNEENLENRFSGEEGFGKFVDLHRHYELFINLKEVLESLAVLSHDYLYYLDIVHRFEMIPKSAKKTSEYTKYLNDLMIYLEEYFSRAKPLLDVHKMKEELKSQFESAWEKETIVGWKKENEDITMADERLYCSPCQKQFTNDSVFQSHLTGKKHLKNASSNKIANSTDYKKQSDNTSRNKTLALNEVLIRGYLKHLDSIIQNTKSNIERKQSRTLEEREEDIEEEETEQPEMAEEDLNDVSNEKLYNPLKLPLGWDGKPIPYWLYKLHGLGVKFLCEICGNYTYLGRKAYDKHFQEWRHAYGMRCLGIPNSKHFQEISNIKDAQNLWEKLKHEGKDVFKPEAMEEFEDLEGNVFNRKTFEDLHRQGLL